MMEEVEKSQFIFFGFIALFNLDEHQLKNKRAFVSVHIKCPESSYRERTQLSQKIEGGKAINFPDKVRVLLDEIEVTSKPRVFFDIVVIKGDAKDFEKEQKQRTESVITNNNIIHYNQEVLGVACIELSQLKVGENRVE